MKFLIFLMAFLVVACGKKTTTEDPPPKEETSEAGEFVRTEGLTDRFSYRRLVWGSTKDDALSRMDPPTATTTVSEYDVLTFDTSTRGIATTATMVVHQTDGLATIDIVAKDPATCADALPAWDKALKIKYGVPAADEAAYTVWKLADASRIVIEKTGTCSIVYAKDPDTRTSVTKALKAADGP